MSTCEPCEFSCEPSNTKIERNKEWKRGCLKTYNQG